MNAPNDSSNPLSAGTPFDVLVVGGGLGGLTTTALVAKRGLRVALLERATHVGGRATTQEKNGFHFNEGAHALYRSTAHRVLSGLGVSIQGRRPPADGIAVRGGELHALPATPLSLLTTGLLGWSGKLEGARVFARLGSMDLGALMHVPWSTWIEDNVKDEALRAALGALVHVTTYTNAPHLVSAGAVFAQLRLAQKAGVIYVDHGWQTLVDGVAEIARSNGAVIRQGVNVTCATPEGEGYAVSLEGGERLVCRALVLATGPMAARSIVASASLAAAAERLVPAHAACLDLALSRLPNPRATFALGLDAPLYLSVHSRTARVAPPGGALVSTMKYLPAGSRGNGAADLAELEGFVDLLQPGWRDVVVERRWLPSVAATNGVVTSALGLEGRFGPRLPDMERVFVVGDWVGPDGMLLDASLASAERAANELLLNLSPARAA